jgi:hypothetical protein
MAVQNYISGSLVNYVSASRYEWFNERLARVQENCHAIVQLGFFESDTKNELINDSKQYRNEFAAAYKHSVFISVSKYDILIEGNGKYKALAEPFKQISISRTSELNRQWNESAWYSTVCRAISDVESKVNQYHEESQANSLSARSNKLWDAISFLWSFKLAFALLAGFAGWLGYDAWYQRRRRSSNLEAYATHGFNGIKIIDLDRNYNDTTSSSDNHFSNTDS